MIDALLFPQDILMNIEFSLEDNKIILVRAYYVLYCHRTKWKRRASFGRRMLMRFVVLYKNNLRNLRKQWQEEI